MPQTQKSWPTLTTNCVVLTHDLDFGAILAATQGKKPSVVQVRAEDVSPDVIGEQVVTALRQMATELTTGHCSLLIRSGRDCEFCP